MEQLFSLNKDKLMRGILSITKVNEDGSREKLQEFRNIPVQGLGYSLARLFSSKSTDSLLDNYRFKYFQLGTDEVQYTAPGATDFFYQLASALNANDYGTDIDSIVTAEQQLYTTVGVSPIPDTSAIDAVFVEIPDTRVTRVSDTVIKIQLVVDKNMAVNKSIQEIGLFIKNPDENFNTDRAMLAAYKFFKKITKTNQFSLVFDWVIQVVDTTATEEWGVIDTSSTVSYPPNLFYAPISIDASAGTLTFSPIINSNLIPGTYTIRKYYYDTYTPLVPIDTFSINSNTAIISFPVVAGTNNNDGTGYLIIRGTPVDPSFGNYFDCTVPFTIKYTGGGGSGGTGSTGGKGMTGTGDGGGTGSTGGSSGLMYKGPRIGDIDWVMPYTNGVYDYNTSQVVVLKAILPTVYASGDFYSAPGLDKWMVEGGRQVAGDFITASCLAQVHSVTRDPSGYATNVEVIFSALAQHPTGTPTDDVMKYQTFRLYQASGSLPTTDLSLSGIDKLWLQIIDTSGFTYTCKFFTSASSGITFNPDANPSITSSLVKDGPYLKTYRFYGRTVPRGYAGTAGQWNANDPDHEIKPFGPSVHAYVTVRYGQEIANVDLRISNGHIHRRGYGGVNSDPIPYEAESSSIPGFIPGDSAQVIGNFYYKSMVVNFGASMSALSYIDKWHVNVTPTAGTYDLVSAFPVNPDPTQQQVHCLPSMKGMVHRFGIFKTANVSSLTFAKHETRQHYQAYPKVNSGRSYQKLREWGFHRDIIPNYDAPLFSLPMEEDQWNGYMGNRNDGIGGIAGQRRMMRNAFNRDSDTFLNGTYNLNPPMGFGNGAQSGHPFPIEVNCPFMYNDVQQGGAGGVTNIWMTPGTRQVYEELDAANARYESTVPRQQYMFTVSGTNLTVKDILTNKVPAALTDASGYRQSYINDPLLEPYNGPGYGVDMANPGTTDSFLISEYPVEFVRALGNSRRSQPAANNINSNVGNKCPYFYRATQIYQGSNSEGMGMFDYAHSERAMWAAYILSVGRNDPMAKEDLENIAEFYYQLANPYILHPFNSYTGAMIGNFGTNAHGMVPKVIRATSPQFSGFGYDIYTGRGTGLQTQLMVNMWSVANDTWRTNHQPYFDHSASGYAYGCSRENGMFLCGGTRGGSDEGSPPVNMMLNGLINGNFYKRFTTNHQLNTLPTGRSYWLQNPDANPYLAPAGLGGTDSYLVGGCLDGSSGFCLSFQEMYLKEAALSLARVVLPTSSTLKQTILNNVVLGVSSVLSYPIFDTTSGVLGDIHWADALVDLAQHLPPNQTQTINYLVSTVLTNPDNRIMGMSYWWPTGPSRDAYILSSVAGTGLYGSGTGQRRTYLPSEEAFARGVQGQQFFEGGVGSWNGQGRNRFDIWGLIGTGLAASISDAAFNAGTSSTYVSNFLVKEAPKNMTSDTDRLAPFFLSTTDQNLLDRANWGVTNAIKRESGEDGLKYLGHYLAYLLKFLGYQ